MSAIRAEKLRRSQHIAVADAKQNKEAVRARCKRLSVFVREAWKHIPELTFVPYVEGWHIEFICLHLEAITFGRFLDMGLQNRLKVNVPPGTMKSLLISVFWPAWEWANGFAHYQYLTTSYREDNCNRDTRRMRDLCVSEWYQTLYGETWKDDKGNVINGVVMVATGIARISNKAGGWREGMPFGSLTNMRGDRLIIDDPHSIKTAESDATREETELTFRESATTRVNDPIKSAIVLIMQRLHVRDLSGVIEQMKLPYVSVMLPMEFEEDRRCVTPLGRDPRVEEGELLFPQRFPREVVERDKIPLGANGTAGQFQQRPYLRDGSMFDRTMVKTAPAAPAGTRWVRHWDLAASKKKGKGIGQSWTAGVLLGRAPDGTWWVGHVARIMEEGDAVRRLIKQTAALDKAKYGGPEGINYRISLPQDPGQAGKVQAKDMVSMLSGYRVRAVPESGDKVMRAEPFSSQVAMGNVTLVAGDWNEAYLDELGAFPGSPTKDQIDATSGAFAAHQAFGGDHLSGSDNISLITTGGGGVYSEAPRII